MIALLQRVRQAAVHVDSIEIARIGYGLMVLVCAERDDTEKEADLLLKRLINYRVFSDTCGKMNVSLSSIGGELLLVPQFTLAADTQSGTRPSFSPAAPAADLPAAPGHPAFRAMIRSWRTLFLMIFIVYYRSNRL